jgi:DNA-binding NtrC family response regulator
MANEVHRLISRLGRLLPEDADRTPLRRLERAAAELTDEIDRLRTLLARTVDVAAARGLEPVGEHILDAMIAILGARRGFIGIATPTGWRFAVARNMARDDIDDPAAEVSASVIEECLETGEPVVLTDAGSGRFGTRRSVHALQLKSVICLPFGRGSTRGFVYLDDPGREGRFEFGAIAVLESWLPLVSAAIARAVEEGTQGDPFPDFITRSPALQRELEELARVAQFDVPILLTGETGTGKTTIARCLHQISGRKTGTFVHVNCGAIPESLIEGELFGTTKGAFTGAQAREGKFEAANGGTLFLDELDSMPIECQVKLLVAVQERWVTRLGSNQRIDVDVRLIAAMNQNPHQRIADGKLREDLYYRLAVIVGHIPPLRERPEDVPLLARRVLEQSSRRYGVPPTMLSDQALDQMMAHSWPGNVRELENVLDRAALLARDGVIDAVKVTTPPPATAPTASRQAVGGAVASLRRRRYGIPEGEFLDAWARGDGHAETVAELLGCSTRTIFRLRRRFVDGED